MMKYLLGFLLVFVIGVIAMVAGLMLWATLKILVEEVIRTVYIVEGKNMEPFLADGSCVIMWKANEKRLQHGKIVYVPKIGIVRMDGIVDQTMRIIGMPGDVVELSGKAVFLNDCRLDEPYIVPPAEDYAYLRYEVPEGSYFLLGDNRPEADDSRKHGAYPACMVCKVMLYDVTKILKVKKVGAVFRALERFCK